MTMILMIVIDDNDIDVDDYQILEQRPEPRQGVADFQAVQGSSKGFLCSLPWKWILMIDYHQ